MTCLSSRHFHPVDLSMPATATPFHDSVKSTVPSLIALLGLNHLLPGYTITMPLAGCALLVYFLAISGQLKFSLGGYCALCISNNCMIWSGKLLVGLLASPLFPQLIRFVLFLPFWIFVTIEKSWLLFIYNRHLCPFFQKMAPGYFTGGEFLLGKKFQFMEAYYHLKHWCSVTVHEIV